jgi:hypothetical protein
MIGTLLASIESNRAQSHTLNNEEHERLLAISTKTIVASTLTSFLLCYAPFQLLADRSRPGKIRLQRRILSTCTLLEVASKLVAEAQSKVDGTVHLDRLQEALAVDKRGKRSTLPHPMWKSRHDAILILAISKHGWIDQNAICRAITDDPDVKWGAPFDSSEHPADDDFKLSSVSSDLIATSNRVAGFLNTHHSALEEFKAFNQDLVVHTYGLNRLNDSEGHQKWAVDGENIGLSPGSVENNDCVLAELPTKKDLVKRAKLVLTRSANKVSLEEKKASEKSSYGLAVLDQSERCNVFLGEMLRGLLKTSATSKFAKTLCAAALQEARKRVEETIVFDGNESSSTSHVELMRIWQQLHTVKQNLSKSTTQCKNLVRVMLGEEPVKAKNGDEALFPNARPAPLILLPAASASREWSVAPDQRKEMPKTDRPAGETMIDKARKKLKAAYSDANKFAALDTSGGPILELTEIETLLLLTLCMYGLPVWSNSGVQVCKAKGWGRRGPFSWGELGRLLKVSASKELEKAEKRLKSAKANRDYTAKNNNVLLNLLDLESDFLRQEAVVAQADEYGSEPETLAKKAVMLIAKVREQWSVTIVKKYTERAYHGLGCRTMVWLENEVARWAHSLDLLDSTGKPLAFTAVDFLDDVPDTERAKIQISSMLVPKHSRQVVAQVALVTRLRSMASLWDENEFNDKIDRAVKKNVEGEDVWENEPPWWRSTVTSNQYDKYLAKQIVKVGMTDDLLEKFYAIGERVRLTRIYVYLCRIVKSHAHLSIDALLISCTARQHSARPVAQSGTGKSIADIWKFV